MRLKSACQACELRPACKIMVEAVPLSPDSGIGESPFDITESLVEVQRRTSEAKARFHFLTACNMFAEAASSVVLCSENDSSVFANLVSLKKPYWNSGEKNSSRSEKRQLIKRNFGNNLKRKTYKRQRKSDTSMDTDDTSPVLEPKSNGFVCRLCFQPYEDAVSLATHKCARIVNESYTCSECGKIFANPANLASHRRWHKPKGFPTNSKHAMIGRLGSKTLDSLSSQNNSLVESEEKMNNEKNKDTSQHKSVDVTCVKQNFHKAIFPCHLCKRRFRRNSNLRKHIQVKHNSKPSSCSLVKVIAFNSDEECSDRQMTRESNTSEAPLLLHHSVNAPTKNVFSATETNLQSLPAYSQNIDDATSTSLQTQLRNECQPFPRDSANQSGSHKQSTSKSSDQIQPLDLRTKKLTNDKLSHGIAEIIKSETGPKIVSNPYFQPGLLAYTQVPLLCHNSDSRLSFPSTLEMQSPFSVPFCRCDPFLTQIHRAYGTTTENLSGVSGNFIQNQKRE